MGLSQIILNDTYEIQVYRFEVHQIHYTYFEFPISPFDPHLWMTYFYEKRLYCQITVNYQ